MTGKIVDGKIVSPPLNDGNKFNVDRDSEWLAEHGFRELTSEEIEAAAVAEEIAFQAAKPPRLKQRENKYLGIIGELIAAGVPLAAEDDSDAIEAKIEAASLTDTGKLKFSARLLAAMNDITQNGGTWDRLPAQPHNLEE